MTSGKPYTSPRDSGEREGPAPKAWEGEGVSLSPVILVRGPLIFPLLRNRPLLLPTGENKSITSEPGEPISSSALLMYNAAGGARGGLGMQDVVHVTTVDAGEIHEQIAAIYAVLGGICTVIAARDPGFTDELKAVIEARAKSEGRPTTRNMMRAFVQMLGEPAQMPTLSVIMGGRDDD